MSFNGVWTTVELCGTEEEHISGFWYINILIHIVDFCLSFFYCLLFIKHISPDISFKDKKVCMTTSSWSQLTSKNTKFRTKPFFHILDHHGGRMSSHGVISVVIPPCLPRQTHAQSTVVLTSPPTCYHYPQTQKAAATTQPQRALTQHHVPCTQTLPPGSCFPSPPASNLLLPPHSWGPWLPQ